MARGRSSGYEDQRELILQRAAELFAQRGYSATSMNGVAEACGLSKPALYHYFRDKYDLLVNIAENHVHAPSTGGTQGGHVDGGCAVAVDVGAARRQVDGFVTVEH